MNTTLSQAKILRKNLTPQERKLWNILRNSQFYGFKFKRQVPIGNYVADFVCEIHNLIIEIDGGQHNVPDQREKDENRTEFFISQNYKVLRFWNFEIDKNIDDVCNKIYITLMNKN